MSAVEEDELTPEKAYRLMNANHTGRQTTKPPFQNTSKTWINPDVLVDLMTNRGRPGDMEDMEDYRGPEELGADLDIIGGYGGPEGGEGGGPGGGEGDILRELYGDNSSNWRRVNETFVGLLDPSSDSSNDWRQQPTNPESPPDAILFPLLLAAIGVCAVIGNLIVLFSFFTYRRMRTGQNLMLANISFADLIFIFITVPVAVINHVTTGGASTGGGSTGPPGDVGALTAPSTAPLHPQLCRFVHYVIFVGVYVTVYTLVVTCVFRFFGEFMRGGGEGRGVGIGLGGGKLSSSPVVTRIGSRAPPLTLGNAALSCAVIWIAFMTSHLNLLIQRDAAIFNEPFICGSMIGDNGQSGRQYGGLSGGQNDGRYGSQYRGQNAGYYNGQHGVQNGGTDTMTDGAKMRTLWVTFITCAFVLPLLIVCTLSTLILRRGVVTGRHGTDHGLGPRVGRTGSDVGRHLASEMYNGGGCGERLATEDLRIGGSYCYHHNHPHQQHGHLASENDYTGDGSGCGGGFVAGGMVTPRGGRIGSGGNRECGVINLPPPPPEIISGRTSRQTRPGSRQSIWNNGGGTGGGGGVVHLANDTFISTEDDDENTGRYFDVEPLRSCNIKTIPLRDVDVDSDDMYESTQNSLNDARGRRELTVLVLASTVVRCLCWLPLQLLLLVDVFTPLGAQDWGSGLGGGSTYSKAVMFGVCFAFASTCVNPFVYNCTCAEFRRVNARMFSGMCCRSGERRRGRDEATVARQAIGLNGVNGGPTSRRIADLNGCRVAPAGELMRTKAGIDCAGRDVNETIIAIISDSANRINYT